MKFGIRLIDYLGTIKQRVELTVLAEKAGFEYAWYPHDTFMHNTWVITTAAAMHTSTIQLGSVGTNPFTTNPAEIATYIASLDELSDGRAVLGLGLHTHEMVEWTGIDASHSISATREATDIIRALLRGEVVAYQGSQFRWSEQCYLRMKPLRAEVPIYICAFGPEYLALSGEIGDGSLPMITPPQSAAYMVPAISRGATTVGRDPQEVDISACAWLSLAASPGAPTDVLRQMIAYFGWALEAPALQTIGLTPEDFAPIKALVETGDYRRAADLVTDQMCDLALHGTPRQVIAQIERLAELGVTQVNLGGPLGPDPKEAIRLMGEQVIPWFRT